MAGRKVMLELLSGVNESQQTVFRRGGGECVVLGLSEVPGRPPKRK